MKLGPIDSGPIDLSTGASLPAIADVERLTLRPGDALVVRYQHKIRPDQVAHVVERVRAILKLDSNTPVLVLDDAATVEVVEQAGEITR